MRKINDSWPLFLLKAATGGGRIVALALFFFMGYLFRDMQLYDRTNYMHNVRILDKLSDYDYRIQTEYGSPWVIKFCRDYIPDLDPGMTLEVLVFEDRGNCRSVAAPQLGFIVKRNRLTGKFINFNTKEN